LTIHSSAQLIQQFGLFYLLILGGYLVARFSEKGRAINVHLTGLLVKLLIPLLTIFSILTTPPEAFLELPAVIVLTILVVLLGPVVLYVRLRRREVDNATKGAFYTCVTFNNALFIPLPLVMMFIGQEGVPFVILFSIVQLFLFASIGSAIGSAFGETGTSLQEIARRTFAFPPLFAVILATALNLYGFSLPSPIASVLSYSGPVTTYLSLVTVGLGVGPGTWMRDVGSALEVVAIRQVIVPLLILPIVVFSGLSPVASQVVLIEAMMPPAVLAVVYASWFGFNSEKAATIVTVGTLLLLPELPLLLLMIR